MSALDLVACPGSAGIIELVFDDPARPVNVLSMEVIDELERALDDLGRRNGVTALVLRSEKEGTFVAGADLLEIAAVDEAAAAVAHATRVQGLFGRLSALGVPVVAAIRGACLGGGLELALACHRRFAADDDTTRLGLPEVKLGLIPGFGGTQRLPRLVGLRTALKLVLKGFSVNARQAREMGLVDEVLPPERFLDLAREGTERLARDGRRPRRTLPLADRLLSRIGPLRDLYFVLAERAVRKETGGYYPAPVTAVEAMREGLKRGLAEGLEVEARLVGGLAVSPECKGLIRLHFLSEAVRKSPGADLDLAQPIAKVGVIGAGVMGAGIAALVAASDLPVRLRDVGVEPLRLGLARIARSLAAYAQRRRLGVRDAQRWLALVSPTTTDSGMYTAGVVIEAVVEDMAMKIAVIKQVGEQLAPEAVLATNTSALSVSEIARCARHPERVVGLHFFNPVDRMPLVEVVRGADTSERALATAVSFARRLGKVAVVVADGPGFLVNRVLAPYLMEALLLLGEGVAAASIEQAMVDFGMPMGPLLVLDEVGLDVASHVAESMEAAFPERLRAPPLLAAMVECGRLGRKVGHGFYDHRRRRRRIDPGLRGVLARIGVKGSPKASERGPIQERLLLAMVNEAMRALEERVVRTPGECDLALVLGAGFPPFRGGLLAFASTRGTDAVISSLKRLEAAHGARFQPARVILELAGRGKSLLDARDVLE